MVRSGVPLVKGPFGKWIPQKSVERVGCGKTLLSVMASEAKKSRSLSLNKGSILNPHLEKGSGEKKSGSGKLGGLGKRKAYASFQKGEILFTDKL